MRMYFEKEEWWIWQPCSARNSSDYKADGTGPFELEVSLDEWRRIKAAYKEIHEVYNLIDERLSAKYEEPTCKIDGPI